MVCLKALALSIATISALIATGTLASPVERQLRRFDVSADCATHQAGAERIPCSGTPEHGKAAARDVQLTDLYVRYPFPCYTLQRLKISRAHLLGPKQGPHSQQLDPMPDKDPGVHHLMARELEVATTEETLAEPRTIEARSHVDSFDAERRDERRTARGIHPPRHSKRVDLVSFCCLMQSFGAMPTSPHSSCPVTATSQRADWLSRSHSPQRTTAKACNNTVPPPQVQLVHARGQASIVVTGWSATPTAPMRAGRWLWLQQCVVQMPACARLS